MSVASTCLKIIAPALICGALATAPVAAKEMKHHKRHHTAYRSLTVRQAAAPVVVAPAYDPFGGPAPFITGPVNIAGTLVDLPFRILASIFPTSGDPASNPFVLIGMPIQAGAQVAQLPFSAIDQIFGATPAPRRY